MKPPRIIRTLTRRGPLPVPGVRVRRFGPPPVGTYAIEVSAQGLYRVADPAVEGYELYRGLAGAEPDFGAAPFDTFTALPHTTAAIADGTHRFVLRYRNRYGLLSQNTAATQIVVAAGTETPTPPSAPYEVAATATAAGTVTIEARYRNYPDSTNAADAWLVYLTTNGVDPNPALDTPVEVAMNLPTGDDGDGTVELSYVTAAQTEGTTVKAIVRTRRNGSPDVDSTNTAIVSATATLLGPAVVDPADAFFGEYDGQA